VSAIIFMAIFIATEKSYREAKKELEARGLKKEKSREE
jgi:hypothetical protein